MKIKVKFFASYRELLGKDKEEFQLKKGAMLKNLRKLMVSTHPILKDIEGSRLSSLNENLVEDGRNRVEGGRCGCFFPSFKWWMKNDRNNKQRLLR